MCIEHQLPESSKAPEGDMCIKTHYTHRFRITPAQHQQRLNQQLNSDKNPVYPIFVLTGFSFF